MDRTSKISVGTDATLREVMSAIDNGGHRVALLVTPLHELVATATDGDVRRALLAGAALDDPALEHANREPHSLREGQTRRDALALMHEHRLVQIPVLDAAGRVIDLWDIDDIVVPLAEPKLNDKVMAYLAECVETNFVSSVGPFVDRFEQEFAAATGAAHAVACASGTAALHVAFMLAGVGPGSLVAVPTFTFIASANAVAYTGADLLLVDSERETWNMDSSRLYDEVVRRSRVGQRIPSVVQVVHVLGHPADIEPLLALQAEFGLTVVEDAAEALGATYVSGPLAGRSVGTIGDTGCFSFNGNKIITTGGGGMIVTDDPELARRARHLTTQAKLPGRDYIHDEIGFNYRLPNLLAAVGVAQLADLPDFLSAKRAMASRYESGLAASAVELPPSAAWASPSFWLYSVLLNRGGPTASAVLDQLNAQGVQARPLWPPLHRQKPYVSAERLGGEVAEDITDRGLSLPSSVGLTIRAQQGVVDTFNAVLASLR